MPKPRFGGIAQRQGLLISQQQGRRPPPPLRRNGRNTAAPDRQWTAIIQFSARHLFCPAHAFTKLAMSAPVRASLRHLKGIYSVRLMTSRCLRTEILHRRQLSTAVALASDPASNNSSTRERHQHQRQQHTTQDSPSIPRFSPSSSSSPAAKKSYLGTRSQVSARTFVVDDGYERIKITDTSVPKPPKEPISTATKIDHQTPSIVSVNDNDTAPTTTTMPSLETSFASTGHLRSLLEILQTPSDEDSVSSSAEEPRCVMQTILSLDETAVDAGSTLLLTTTSASKTLIADQVATVTGQVPTVPEPRQAPRTSAPIKQDDSTASWRFPTFTNHSTHTLDGIFFDRVPHHDRPSTITASIPNQVRSWASTSKALAHFYGSLHKIRSTATTSPDAISSNTALRMALIHYNFLTRLQTEYDTILVPRRDTRTLYLLQGRQPKTPENLEQLLKIAMDLIWLNEKDRRKKRILVSEDKQNGTVNSTSNSKNYHGLRVSEYTILMNWIGSIGKDQRENENRVSPSPSSSQGTTANHPDPIVFGPPSFTAGPADRAWGIWQDFLLTGMKPDVVLYTALMDTLLNAKEYTRADQIWRHMHGQEAPLHHLDGNDGCDYSSRYSSTALGEPNVQLTNMNHVMDTVSKTLSHGAKLSPVDTGRRKSTQESPSLQKDDKQHQHQHQHWQQGPRIVPNLQTFSVVMQAFVLKRDLQGVAQTYKELIQALSPSPAVATSSTPVSLPHHVNTVLLNQILRVLVDLGELDAAKEIYAKMRESTSGQKCSVRRPAWGNRYYDDDQDDQNGEDKKHHAGGCTSDAVSWPPHMTTAPVPALSNPGGSTSSTLSASLPTLTTSPLHHRSSLRRSVWETRQKWRQEFSPESTLPSSSSSSSTQLRSLSRSSLSIAPNECTHHLILQLARRKRDQELEDIALSYLEQP